MDHIELSHSNGVQTIRINRAEKKNALTSDMYSAMARALNDGDGSSDIRAHLILGQPGTFTAGNDIGDFIKAATATGGLGGPVLDFLKAIATSQKPIVAGVDGLAIGVGTTLLMHCDMAYASHTSRFKTPFVDLGIVPEAGSTLLGPKIMGHAAAFELLVMGAEFSASRAYECGLINGVTASEDLEEKALAAAVALSQKPPEALSLSRQLLRGKREDIVARIDEEAALFAQRLKSPEAQNAFMSFMSKS